MGDWGGLIVDILFMIAERIQVVKDFLSFSSVCARWRAAARSLRRVQSLMLRSRYGVCLNTNEIYSFARDKICKFTLPENKIIEEQFYTNGWILTRHRCGDMMSLMHPFSGHVISLPPKNASGVLFNGIKKAVLSSSPSFFPDDYTLMVIQYDSWQYSCSLSFWKPGDREWTVLQKDYTLFFDVIYCRGQFYAVDQHGVIYVYDIRGSDPTVAMPIGRIPTVQNLISVIDFHLAATDSHSLLVIVARVHCGKASFTVYELDLIGKGGLNEVNDLGAKTIFVSSYHESVCVEHSKFPPGIIKADDIVSHEFHCSEWGCRNGCPVIEHLHKRGMCMRIYSLKSEEAQDFFHPLES